MGRIISAYVFPHPPVIIPEVGGGRENDADDTLKACRRAAQDISNEKPSTIIVTTPHGPVFQDYIYMGESEKLTGNLADFGASDVCFEYLNNKDLAQSISKKARDRGIKAGGLERTVMKRHNIEDTLDHGVMVPLYFVNRVLSGFKLVRISISGYPNHKLYEFGMCIRDSVADSSENVVFIASGDLSHRLSRSAPYGYSPEGSVFDSKVVESIRNMDAQSLVDMSPALCESAGECGLRSFIMMMGALDGYSADSNVYSYEGPFGVGYVVARIRVDGRDSKRHVMENMEKKHKADITELRNEEDPYVKLARQTLESYVREGREIGVPEGLPDEMTQNRAGVFVSLKKFGSLRGCIGTTGPVTPSIAHEIINNAISAGTRDPRFPPVEEDELDSIVYSVDVLMEPEPIDSIEQLDVKKYGVIVRSGMRTGLLLPGIEGVDMPEKQVSIALQKAGIGRDEDFKMERFEVIRHK